MGKSHKVVRSAITGQYRPAADAKKNPKTTVVETVKTPPKKRK